MGPQLVRCGKPSWQRRRRSPPPSFNGAATCSLRKDWTLRRQDSNGSDLQWGRNLFVAESVQWKSIQSDLVKPSMGPQLVRCGKCLNPHVFHDPEFFLQWGRNLFVAESRSCNVYTRIIRLPSMGPQLVRCGKLLEGVALRILVAPSMGPQLVRCGKRIYGRDTV